MAVQPFDRGRRSSARGDEVLNERLGVAARRRERDVHGVFVRGAVGREGKNFLGSAQHGALASRSKGERKSRLSKTLRAMAVLQAVRRYVSIDFNHYLVGPHR